MRGEREGGGIERIFQKIEKKFHTLQNHQNNSVPQIISFTKKKLSRPFLILFPGKYHFITTNSYREVKQ